MARDIGVSWNQCLPYGKYGGYKVRDVAAKDRQYVIWAASVGIVDPAVGAALEQETWNEYVKEANKNEATVHRNSGRSKLPAKTKASGRN